MTAPTSTETAVDLRVQRSELARGLRAAAAIRSQAIRLAFTGSTVAMEAYTGETAVRVELDAGCGPQDGGVFIPRVLLANLLPYLANDVEITVDNDELKVRIASGGDTYELLQAVKTGNRHELDAERGADAFAIEAPTLVEVLRRALPFASHDQTRPVLATIALYLTEHVAAATDSYRLAVVRWDDGPEPTSDATPLLIRRPAAEALRRMLGRRLGKVTISTTDTHVLVDFDDQRWSILRVTLNGGRGYPLYSNLIPEDASYTATVKVDREDLLATCRAAAVMAVRNAPMRLKLDVLLFGVSVSASTPDHGSMTRRLASASHEGEDMEIGFNPGFLADACANAPVERLTLRLVGKHKPMLVEAARDRYLLMPIRLDV